MSNKNYPVSGAGLGLRRSMLGELPVNLPKPLGFLEVAPENWIGLGGRFGHEFAKYTAENAFVCHGLSLSIGGPAELNVKLVKDIKQFMYDHKIKCYSEHLSYCSDDGQLYDLLPIPFTSEAVSYVAARIKQVQDILEQNIAIENASYYAAPGQELSEIEFINAVIDEADCLLLLDVNNIYVNSINHRYDPVAFLTALPGDRISYAHVAGHYNEAEDLIVDTHGADVIDPVWQLLDKAYETFGVFPTLLERDFNIPSIDKLVDEVKKIDRLQQKWSAAE